MHNMYNLINKKEESVNDFIEFLDFMIDQSKYSESSNFKYDKDDFDYHFYRIPLYTRDIMQKLKFNLIKDVSSISMMTDRLNKRINSFTDMS